MKSDCLRWGFFGAGRCTHDFVSALKLLPLEHHRTVAIAARDPMKARQFAENLGLERACESYLELAQSSDIDIIYIGTVNSEHFHQSKLSLEHGKSVLCEKPVCINRNQVCELLQLAKQNKSFFMEGFWTFFFPATKKLLEEVQKGSIGKVVHMTAEIGNKFHHLDRFSRKEIGGGSLINHGVYGIMFAYLLLGKPSKIKASGIISETGTDESVAVVLTYEETAQLATVVCSSKADMPGELKVIGTEGTLKLHYPFWASQTLETPTGKLTFELPEFWNANVNFNNLNSIGFTYEATEVRRSIQQGQLESDILPWEASLAVMEIADEARKQIGVIYDQDKNFKKEQVSNGHLC